MLTENHSGFPVTDRRRFISKSVLGFGSIILCEDVLSRVRKLEAPVKIGIQLKTGKLTLGPGSGRGTRNSEQGVVLDLELGTGTGNWALKI